LSPRQQGDIYLSEMSRSFRFPTLEDGLSVLSKDELADSLAYNSIKVCKSIFVFLKNEFVHLFILNTMLLLLGLILSNAFGAQKNIEDEGCTIAPNNLRSEVIELRNEGLEKDNFIGEQNKRRRGYFQSPS
jgi:predicted membrane protein